MKLIFTGKQKMTFSYPVFKLPKEAVIDSAKINVIAPDKTTSYFDTIADARGFLLDNPDTNYSVEIGSDSGVTSIPNGTFAFMNCGNMTALKIPNSVTSIGYGSLSYTGLVDLELPDSVTEMFSSAVSNCSALRSVKLPYNFRVDSSSYLFSNCTSLQTVTFGAGMTAIGQGWFSSCSALTAVSIPDTVETIKEGVFAGCTHLSDVVLSSKLKAIPSGVFSSCLSLQSITIPASVEMIGLGAFATCRSLSDVSLQNGIKTISGGAFSECTSLKEITIPASVITIETGAFSGNTGMTITIEKPQDSISGAPWGAVDPTIIWTG